MKTLEKLRYVYDDMRKHLFERDEEIECLIIASISSQNILFIGSPGTAKSMGVRLFSNSIKGAKFFTRLITKFTVPEELYGPLKISQLEHDIYERNIDSTLLDCNFAFLDEVFKGNSGILNSNLMIMQEREFLNGTKLLHLPLISLVGASNEIPDTDDNLDALYDRFVLKINTRPIVEEDNFINMLKAPLPNIKASLTLDDITSAQKESQNVEIPEEQFAMFAKIRERLSTEGLCPTDRTFKAVIPIIKAKAYFEGRNVANESDLEILKHSLWSDPDKQRQVYSIILEVTNPIMNQVNALFDEAKERYSEATNPSKQLDADGKKKDIKAIVFDTAAKLTSIKDELVKCHAMAKGSGKDLNKITKIQIAVDEMIRTLITKAMKIQGFHENAQ